MIERIKLIDSSSNELVLPKTFNLRTEPIVRRVSIKEIAGAHGGRDFSDGMFKSRHIEISGKIWASSDIEYNQTWDELAKFLAKDNLKIQFKGRVINVLRATQISIEYPYPSDMHISNIAIQFVAEDPFWYETISKTKIFQTNGASPYEFSFDVGGNVDDIYPVINITSYELNTSFSLENVSDSNRSFTFSDSETVTNSVVSIDSQKGTVELNGNSKIASFSGRFLRLLGGRTNNLKYTGANARIELLYTEKWL